MAGDSTLPLPSGAPAGGPMPLAALQHDRQIASLYATAHDLAALREIDDVLSAIVRRAHTLMAADLTYLQVYEEETGEIRTRAVEGVVTSEFRKITVPVDVGIARLALQHKSPYWVPDYSRATDFPHDSGADRVIAAEGLVGVLAVPMFAGNRIVGVLNAGFRSERSFAPEEVALLAAYADHAAVALENARLFDESRRALADLREAYDTIQAHAKTVERTDAVHAAMTKVILHGGAAGDVADILVSHLGGRIKMVDSANRSLVERGAAIGPRINLELRARAEGPDDSHNAVIAEALEQSRRTGRVATTDLPGSVHHEVLAIVADNTYLGGVIHTGGIPLAPADLATLERAGQITALLTLMQDARVEAEERVRGELLTEILSGRGGSAEDLSLRARARQVSLPDVRAVVIALVEDGWTRDGSRALQDLARGSGGLAGEHLGIPTMLSVSDESVGEVAVDAQRHLSRKLNKPVLVCAAPTSGTPDDMGRAQQLAVRCARLVRQFGTEHLAITTEEFGMYGLVFDPDRGETLRSFVTTTIGPLIDRDTASGSSLVRTLEVLFEHGSNQAQCARALNVHINTLLKRLERVAAVLGTDWQRPDRMLALQLAVRFHSLMSA